MGLFSQFCIWALLFQHDPRRRMIAGAFLAAQLAVDAGLDEARGGDDGVVFSGRGGGVAVLRLDGDLADAPDGDADFLRGGVAGARRNPDLRQAEPAVAEDGVPRCTKSEIMSCGPPEGEFLT